MDKAKSQGVSLKDVDVREKVHKHTEIRIEKYLENMWLCENDFIFISKLSFSEVFLIFVSFTAFCTQ